MYRLPGEEAKLQDSVEISNASQIDSMLQFLLYVHSVLLS